jgi:hypothetical protein
LALLLNQWHTPPLRLQVSDGSTFFTMYDVTIIIITTTSTLRTIISADDQILISASEDDLQRAVFQLQNVLKNYNMETSEERTKSVAVAGKTPRELKY